MRISVTTNENHIITAYGVCLSAEHKPLPNGTIIETDDDLETLIGNYKLVDGVLVELPEAEKITILPEPTLEQRNRANIDYIGMMTGVL